MCRNVTFIWFRWPCLSSFGPGIKGNFTVGLGRNECDVMRSSVGSLLDLLLFATMTSGTTERNKSSQRDYLLTLDLVDVRTGVFTKEQAEISKGYHRSPLGKLANYSLFPAGR